MQAPLVVDAKTYLASVVFMDLVGFSKQPVASQMERKRGLSLLLRPLLDSLSGAANVTLDTGDGAAIGFLGDPEVALFCVMSLHHELSKGEVAGIGLKLADLKIGVNLGAVKLVEDVNGRPNLVGDGINSAERVMSFASVGEIKCSRSFRDAVSCLDVHYEQLFGAAETHSDKHGKLHECYPLIPTAQALEAALRAVPTALQNANGVGNVTSATSGESPLQTSKSRIVPTKLLPPLLVLLMAAAGVFAFRAGIPTVQKIPTESEKSGDLDIPARPLSGAGPDPVPVPSKPQAAELVTSYVAPVPEPQKRGPAEGASTRGDRAQEASEKAVASFDKPSETTVTGPETYQPRLRDRVVTNEVAGKCSALLLRLSLGELIPSADREYFTNNCK